MISRNLTGISTNVYMIIKTGFNLVTKRAHKCLFTPQNPAKTPDVHYVHSYSYPLQRASQW